MQPGIDQGLDLRHLGGAENAQSGGLLFYGTQSCPPCTGLREACQNTVNRNFARELAVGTVLLREVNIDAPENRLIQPHLHGAMVTIALVDYRTGKPRDWRLLTDQVWRLRSDETAFSAMLRDEIRKMLK